MVRRARRAEAFLFLEAVEPRLLLDGGADPGPQVVDHEPDAAVDSLSAFEVTFAGPIDAATFGPDDVQVLSGHAEPAGSHPLDGKLCRTVDVVGSTVYCAGGDEGLTILDIGNPEDPAVVSSCSLAGAAKDICVAGGRVYVVVAGEGLQILDVSDPQSPQPLGTWGPLEYARAVQVVGELAYVLDNSTGLHVLDVSDPAVPQRLGGYDSDHSTRELEVVGAYAFVGQSDGMAVLNVSSPTEVQLVGFCPGVYAQAIRALDECTVLLADSAELHVLDVTDPTQPAVVATVDMYTTALGIDVAGHYAYVTTTDEQLHVLDVEDPAQPQRLWQGPTMKKGEAVALAGPLAILPEGPYGVEIHRIGPDVADVVPLDATTFRVELADPAPEGEYAAFIGPQIADEAGRRMDQDGDGVGGEFQDVCRLPLVVDTSPPPAPPRLRLEIDTGLNPDDGLTGDLTPHFFWDEPEDPAGIAGYEYQWNDGPWAWSDTDGVGREMSEGDHVFRVRATDGLGHVGEPAEFPFTIERDPPTAPTDLRLRNRHLSWSPASDENGIWRYEYRFPDWEWLGSEWLSTAETTAPVPVAQVSPGWYNFEVRAYDNAGNRGPVASARLEVLPPLCVVGAWPARQAVVPAGDLPVSLRFSRPIDQASLDRWDVTLEHEDSGVLHFPWQIDCDAGDSRLRLDYAGLPEGAYRLTVHSADEHITDQYGNWLDGEGDFLPSGDGTPGGDFCYPFRLEATDAFHTTWCAPLEPLAPDGSGAFESRLAGEISTPEDTDEWGLDLPWDHPLSLRARKTGDLDFVLSVRAPAGALLGEVTVNDANPEASLDNLSATVGGRWAFGVTPLGGTSGDYALDLTIGAAAETESLSSASNRTLDLAESLDGVFADVSPGGQRAAVLGSLAPGDVGCYAVSLQAGQAAAFAVAPRPADAKLTLQLIQWDGVVPEEETIPDARITDMADGSSRVLVRGKDNVLKLVVVHKRVRIIDGDTEHVAYVVDRAGRDGAIVAPALPEGTWDILVRAPLETALLAAGAAGEQGASAVHGFVAPAAGTYYLRVAADEPADEPIDYTLVATRDLGLEREANDRLAGATAIPPGGTVAGYTAGGPAPGLFAYDGATQDICRIDPHSGEVLARFGSPVRSSLGFGLATTPWSLLVGGATDEGIWELDPATGAVQRVIPNPWGDVAAAAFEDGEIVLSLESSRASLPGLEDLGVEIWMGTTLAGVLPLAEGPFVWKLSQTQFAELEEAIRTYGRHAHIYQHPGYIPDDDPNTYWFAFEDMAFTAHPDMDFWNIMLKVEDLGFDLARITVKVEATPFTHHLIEFRPERRVLVENLRYHEGESLPLDLALEWGIEDWLTALGDLYLLQFHGGSPVEHDISWLPGILNPKVAVPDPQVWGICPATGLNDFPKGEYWPAGSIPDVADNQAFIAVDNDAAMLITFGEAITFESLTPPQRDAPSRHFLLQGAGTPRVPCEDGRGPGDADDQELLQLWSRDFRAIDPRSPLTLELGIPRVIVLDYPTGDWSRQAHMGSYPALAAAPRGLHCLRGGNLLSLDPDDGQETPLAELAGITSADGAAVLGGELFVADGDRIEVYDAETFAHARTLTAHGLTTIRALGADETDAGDFFRFEAEAGAQLRVTTDSTVGAAGVGNRLDPVLTLYDPTGRPVAVDDNSHGEWDAAIDHTAAMAGTYTVRVAARGDTAGEYLLDVRGLAPPAPSFTAVLATPAAAQTCDAVTVDFGEALLLTTLEAGDLLVDGLPAEGFEIVEGDTVAFTSLALNDEGVHTLEILPGTLVGVTGRPIEYMAAQVRVDRTPPSVANWWFDAGDGTLRVRFTEDVVCDWAARPFEIYDQTMGYDMGDDVVVSYDPATHVATFEARGMCGGRFPYGRYVSIDLLDQEALADLVGNPKQDPLILVGFVAGAGDVNRSGRVDRADFLALRAHFDSGGGWWQGDLDRDGHVDALDYVALKRTCGSVYLPPEPLRAPLGESEDVAPAATAAAQESTDPETHASDATAEDDASSRTARRRFAPWYDLGPQSPRRPRAWSPGRVALDALALRPRANPGVEAALPLLGTRRASGYAARTRRLPATPAPLARPTAPLRAARPATKGPLAPDPAPAPVPQSAPLADVLAPRPLSPADTPFTPSLTPPLADSGDTIQWH